MSQRENRGSGELQERRRAKRERQKVETRHSGAAAVA
jgi:hypothetical protein